jgi:hypothetical protein
MPRALHQRVEWRGGRGMSWGQGGHVWGCALRCENKGTDGGQQYQHTQTPPYTHLR